MVNVVSYAGVNPSRRAIYCVSPARTQWDPQHLECTVDANAPAETPVLLGVGVAVKAIPRWLAWLFSPSAFTVPGTIYISAETTPLPTELLIHEHVHAARAANGVLRYWWSVITGLLGGTFIALEQGGYSHEWSPIEIEARAIARAICDAYAGAPGPIDAAAEVAKRLS